MKGYKIDFTTNTVTITKDFAKKANEMEGDAYEKLQELRAQGFNIKARTHASPKTKLPHPSVMQMRNYIGLVENSAEYMAMFETACMRKLTIVKMRFKNTLTDVVMDKFGYDINTVPDGENHFTTSVPVVISQQLYAWVFGLGPDAEIVSPPAAVRGMKKAIEGIAERYNAETGVVAEAQKARGRKAYRKKYGTLPLTNSRDEEECKPKGL